MSTKECAEAFRSAVTSQGKGSKMAGFLANARGVGSSGPEFYTPNDSSPFSEFDTDSPAFVVGARVPQFRGGAAGWTTDVQMRVWDRGQVREVSLVADGNEAKQNLEKIAAAFHS